jgi:hypothetical protein
MFSSILKDLKMKFRFFVIFLICSVALLASFDRGQTQVLPTQESANSKATGDALYQQIRRLGSTTDDFNGAVATVTGLTLQREAATFKFNNGEIYFLTPVEGRVVGAVFIGDVEMQVTPPTEVEKRSLQLFTGTKDTPDHFSRLVMRFTDKTFEEIKESPAVKMGKSGGQSSNARDAYKEIQTLFRKEVHYNLDLRTLADLYVPNRPGFFWAFPGGGRFDKLTYVVDPLSHPDVSPEQVAMISFSETEGGIWTSFHLADDYKTGGDLNARDYRVYDISRHEIEGTIRGTRIIATDKVTLSTLIPTRVLPFSLYKSLRVSHVRDDQNRELGFVQEGKDDDADFGVILPELVGPGKTMKLTVEYEGEDALKDSGGGNFILIARTSWYPNNWTQSFGDYATVDVTMRFPKEAIFVGTGAPAGPEQTDGDWKVAKWTSGTTELAVTGFNYGKFIKKEQTDSETGYGLEFYANKELPDEIKEFELFLEDLSRDKVHITGVTGNITTSGMANAALTDAQNSTRIYSAYFGKLPYQRIAMTQQPAFNFGQAWPTLIYMPYTAFIDSTQRTQLMGTRGGSDSFWRYVGPHEIAHQWWGHMVGWKSYRDQWMSEGFAEFSTSLYVQYVRKDMAKFHDFWEAQRKLITEASSLTKGHKPYTVGPITQGYRLDSGKTPNITRAMIYPKGAYVLQMLRMMMFDHRGGGDAKFREMMTDFVKTNLNKNVSTEDFKHAVEKYITPQMDLDKNGKMDWFFNEWVYGTDIPAYKLDYQNGATPDGKPLLTVHVTQSGVSDDFKMLVPIYVDFGKGWTRLGAARMIGNSTVDIPAPLPQAPKKVTLCALDDVLYTSFSGK